MFCLNSVNCINRTRHATRKISVPRRGFFYIDVLPIYKLQPNTLIMGFFNTLITETTCPNCGAKSEIRIQYKYGNTRQLHYSMGDGITWGGNDIGNPALTKV